MVSLYVLAFLISGFIFISTRAFLDWQSYKEQPMSSNEVRKIHNLKKPYRLQEYDKYSVLISADDKDLRWLLTQFELADIRVSEWWLAGVRTWGYPPPPRSTCAPELQDKLDTYIGSWQ